MSLNNISRASVLATLVAVGGCSDVAAPDRRPMTVNWLEWPARVTAGQPGSLRVVTSVTCVDLFLAVHERDDRLVLEAEVSPETPDCGWSRTVDTLIPLPVLQGTPSTRWIEARIYDSFGGTFRQHTFGRVEFGGVFDPTPVVAGWAALYAETNGCGIAIAPGLRAVATTNLPGDSASWHGQHALVQGVRAAATPAPCADAATIIRYGAPLPAFRITHLELSLH